MAVGHLSRPQSGFGIHSVGKPLALTAFGLVTQDNFPFFVPFNSSVPLANQTNSTTSSLSKRITTTQGQAATTTQQQSAYLTWLQAGIDAGVQGLTQYQVGLNIYHIEDYGVRELMVIALGLVVLCRKLDPRPERNG